MKSKLKSMLRLGLTGLASLVTTIAPIASLATSLEDYFRAAQQQEQEKEPRDYSFLKHMSLDEFIEKFNKGDTTLPFDSRDVEKEIFRYVNEERRKYGKSKAAWSPELHKAAKKHALYLARYWHDYYEGEDWKRDPHLSLDGKSFGRRAIEAGYKNFALGENIGLCPTALTTPIQFYIINSSAKEIGKSLVKSWMESPGHRRNIIDPYPIGEEDAPTEFGAGYILFKERDGAINEIGVLVVGRSDRDTLGLKPGEKPPKNGKIIIIYTH